MRMGVWAALAAAFGAAAVFVMPLLAFNSVIFLSGVGAEWYVGRKGYEPKRHHAEVMNKMFGMLIAAALIVLAAGVLIARRTLFK